MFKKIGIGLVVVVGLFLGYGALQKPEYTVARDVSIHASPAVIFPYINDSKKMDSWNPWTEVDPQVKISFSGPEAGVGAKTSWESKGRMGVGSATISESVPFERVVTDLAYTKPMRMVQTAQITLTPSGPETVVSWSVSGKNNFLFRCMGVFCNMDKMVGGTFANGLTKLKALVESETKSR